MFTIDSIVKFITDLGGLAGIATVAVLVIKSITDSRIAKAKLINEALVLKAKVDDDALLAKAQVDKDALLAKAKVNNDLILAKAQADMIAAETDDVIARASDAMVTGMQKRVDALILRVQLSEDERVKQDEEISQLRKRVEVLENLLIKKDGYISKRDDRILELECKVKDQAKEIEHLKAQVRILEEEAKKPKS